MFVEWIYLLSMVCRFDCSIFYSLISLSPQRLDFRLQSLVFSQLALQKPACKGGLGGQALGGEHVDVAKLVFALTKVLDLNPAFINKRLQAVVKATGTNPKLLRDLTLRHVRVVLQHTQHTEIGVFLDLGAAAGHWGLDRLNQGRIAFRDTTVVLCHGQQAR